MTSKGVLSFGVDRSTTVTLRSWGPKLRALVGRVLTLEQDIYDEREVLTNKMLFGSPVYRRIVNFGPLPNATSSSVAHGVSDFARLFSIGGWAKQPGGYIPLPHPSTVTNGNISLSATDTKIFIATLIDYSSWDGFVVFEYTKKG